MLTNTFENTMIGLAFGVMESALNLGIFVSLTFGASITAMYSWRAPYQVLTGLGCPALCLILVLAKTTKRSEHTPLRDILGDSYIRAVMIPSAFLFLSFWSLWTFVPTYLVDVLRVSLSIAGIFSSFPFLLAIFAALVGGLLADRIGLKTASLAVILLEFVFLVLLSFSRSLIVITISLAVVGFAQAYMIPVVLSFVPKRIPQTELGRIFGIILSGSYAAATVGPLVTGRIVDTYGFPAAFLMLAICIGLVGLLIFKNL
jgi:predicted MFS family arabinose efflux permease